MTEPMNLKWYQLRENTPWSGPMLMTEARAAVLRPQYANHGLNLVEMEDPQVSLVEQVKAYARGHYDTGGWDVIVECWDDEAIAGSLRCWGPRDTYPYQCETIEQVLTDSVLLSYVSVWSDWQADARNSAF